MLFKGCNYSVNYLLLFQWKLSISPVITSNLIEHASYYRFYFVITTGIQISCCETATRWLWMTSSCVLFSVSFTPFTAVFPAPVFYFGNTDYHVDESSGFVEVQVWRTGTDLSKVGTITVRSRKTDPISAEGMCRFCQLVLKETYHQNKPSKTMDSSRHLVTFCFSELKSPRKG